MRTPKEERFRLETGLRVRRRGEEAVQFRLARVLEEVEERLEQREQLMQTKQSIDLDGGVAIDAPSLLLRKAYERRIAERVSSVDRELMRLDRERDETTKELLEARKEVKKLESLRENHEARLRRRREKAEEALLDEIGTLRFGRNPGE